MKRVALERDGIESGIEIVGNTKASMSITGVWRS